MNRVLCLLSAALMIGAAPAFADERVKAQQAAQINSDWTNSDVAIAKSVSKLVAEPLMGLNPFLKQLNASDTREDRSIGFGLRQLHLARYGGYTTLWIHVVAQGNTIVALDCLQTGYRDSWSSIVPELRRAWGRQPIENNETSIRMVHFVNRAKIAPVVQRELGAPPKTEPPGSCAKSFDLLLSPLERLDVGDSCYYGGGPPPGREAMNVIIKADRYDLIRAILRGPSPEGRTYAALALIKSKKATDDDNKAIQKLKGMDVQIAVCNGCLVSSSKFAEIVH